MIHEMYIIRCTCMYIFPYVFVGVVHICDSCYVQFLHALMYFHVMHCMYTVLIYTVGPVLNAWLNKCVLRVFFAYIANSMIARVDAAVCGVLLLMRFN